MTRWCGRVGLAGLALAIFGSFAGLSGPAHADPHRLALVVGVGTYQHLPALANTLNDARLIADKLRGVGFDVELETDPGKDTLARAVRGFAHKVEEAGPEAVAAFYYAGHGIQDDKQTNYLIGADADIKSQVDLPFEALPLDRTLEAIEAARPIVTLVMLDACRNNPLPETSRGVKRGLAVEPERRGLLIAFSTDPGKTADDGPTGQDSPFATALAAELDVPGLEATALFKVVTKKVMDATHGEQMPWVTQRLVDDFYFRPAQAGGPTPAVTAATAVASPAPPALAPATTEVTKTEAPIIPSRELAADEAEVAYGRVVLDNTVEGYEAWLRKYPDSERKASVIGLLQRLREEQLWKRSLSSSASDAMSALETEIIAFPNGVYTDRAKQRLAELQNATSAQKTDANQSLPSFDCSKAGSPVEGRICSSPDLAARDRELAEIFAKGVAASGTPIALQNAESQWVKARELCAYRGVVAQIDACIRTAYDTRIAALRDPASPTTGGSPSGRISPSFDCAMAKSAAEHLICEDNELAAADLRMASLYHEALAKGTSQGDLDRNHGQWFASREACAGMSERPQAKECVRGLYQHRIDALAASLGLGTTEAVAIVAQTDPCSDFPNRYFAASSGQGNDPDGFIASAYAPQVLFYGRVTSRSQVVIAKRRLLAQVPHRTYTVVSVRPPLVNDQRCELHGVVSWDVRRGRTTSRALAAFDFVLSTAGKPLILSESGRAISSDEAN